MEGKTCTVRFGSLVIPGVRIRASLKDENALPCSRSQNVYLGLGGKKRRSKRQRNSKDKSRGKFHDAIIPP